MEGESNSRGIKLFPLGIPFNFSTNTQDISSFLHGHKVQERFNTSNSDLGIRERTLLHDVSKRKEREKERKKEVPTPFRRHI